MTDDALVEEVARAIYAVIPNFGMETRPTTSPGRPYEKVRVDDPWEEAPDRHADCRAQARAVIPLISKHVQEKMLRDLLSETFVSQPSGSVVPIFDKEDLLAFAASKGIKIE